MSRKFYDRLGEDIANELVDWFNQVDATYRADLRELNELNFARFDAKLEQRLAELKAYFDVQLAKFDARIERGFKEQRGWFVTTWLSLVATVLALGGLVIWRT